MAEQGIWEQFRMERSPDAGRSIVYAITYPYERLVEHRAKVVAAIKRREIELKDCGDSFKAVSSGNKNEKEMRRIDQLFNRLSCVNEAIEYTSTGLNQYKSIDELRSGLISQYISLLDERKMADAYNLLELGIMSVARSLMQFMNGKNLLSDRDKDAIEEMDRFGKRQYHIMNSPGRYVIFG